jgi:hypothetical protein
MVFLFLGFLFLLLLHSNLFALLCVWFLIYSAVFYLSRIFLFPLSIRIKCFAFSFSKQCSASLACDASVAGPIPSEVVQTISIPLVCYIGL